MNDFALLQQAAAHRGEDRRFETALRIFVAQLEAVMSEPGPTRWPHGDEVKAMAEGAVASADMLLAVLRKEKP